MREAIACVVCVRSRRSVCVRHARAAIEGVIGIARSLRFSVRKLCYVAVQIVLIAFFVLALVVSAVISYREITAGYYDGWKDDENE